MEFEQIAGKRIPLEAFLDKYGHTALTIRPQEPVADAAGHFTETIHGQKYSMAVVVGDDDKVIGVLSLGDIAHALHSYREKTFGLKVADIMTTKIVSVDIDEDLETAMRRMVEHEIRHIPVLSKGVLEGLVTRKDALEGLYDEAALELKHLTSFIFRSGGRY